MADYGSVIVALPSIAEYFDTDLPTAQWVIIGYALSISALLMPMGRLADILGTKQVYIYGFIIFVAGAALAGSSGNVMALIGSKIFQGVGAAMTQGTGMAMVISAFPDSERGRGLGMQLSVVGLGAVAGPALGGFLVGALNWRWVFYSSMIFGVLAVAFALLVLDGRRSSSKLLFELFY